MKIEIKHRVTNKVIVKGDYKSIKECLEKNRGAYLEGAYLRGANLEGAYLEGAYLRGANLEGANLEGAYLEGAYLRGAYLEGAYLEGAYLRGAYLRGANLEGAYLRGAKNYANSHDIFEEIVRRQKVEVFTESEWQAIGIITIHTLCWDSIKKRFGDVMGHIFEVLAKEGFAEWLEYWKQIQS